MPDENTSGVEDSVTSSRKTSAQHAPPRRRRRSQGRRSDSYAALDLGTNNCRLLIAKPTASGFRVVDSYSKVVRLGAGLSSTGMLSDHSMDLAVEAIKHCAKKIGTRNVKRWRCVATQACRQADNGEMFLKRVKEETGISLEVISARVEARLSVMGCLNLIDVSKDVVLVVDIGGGSTELSWVDIRRLREEKGVMRVHRPPISAWASLPLGVVTLTEQVPEHADRAAWYLDMKDKVREAITNAKCQDRFTKVFASGAGHIIGTSGTITSLAAVHLNLPYYQRDKVDGLWMDTDHATTIAREMGHRTPEERAAFPSIGTDRATLLVAGCAIMDVLCEMWPAKKIRVADRGLREGILMGLMQQSQKIELPKKVGISDEQ